MIGIGLVGVGLHGARYAQHLARGDVPGLRLVALARRDAGRGADQARGLGVRFHATPGELVAAPDVDAVVVASPAEAHAEHVRAAVLAGKPTLCEKPLAASVAEARALVRLVAERRARVVVAQTLRWDPLYRRATEEARALAPVRIAHATLLKADFTARDTAESRTRDRHRALFTCGVHHLDWAGQLFPGGFARAFATEAPGEDGLSVHALLEARDGGSFALAIRLLGAGSGESFTVLAERAALAGDRAGPRLERIDGAGRVSLPVEATPTLPLVLAAFRDFVRGEAANPVPVEAGARVVALAEACARSIVAREPIPIDDTNAEKS